MKEKMKKFWEEHKKEVIVGAVGAGVLVLGGVIGYEKGFKKGILYTAECLENSGGIWTVLRDIPNGTNVDIFTGISDTPFTAEELGKLGERMIEEGATAQHVFTHFIALGEHVEQ